MADRGDLEILLERILETVPAGIVHVGHDGAIHRANERAQRFLGLGFDELTSRYTIDFAGRTYFEDGRECSVEEYPVTLCLVTGEAQGPTTIGVEQPGGDVRWAIFTAMPVELDDGRGAVVTLVDITERMAAEQKRLQLEKRLQLSDRLATMGTLAAGVAHEINNPLTYIIGNLDLAVMALQEGRTDIAPLLQDARTGAERVRRIVADLGRFSHISDETGAVSVAHALDSAAAMARPVLRHRARLVAQVDHLAPVEAEEGKLVQVLLNLLLNAAHAIAPGRVEANTITVRGEVVDGHIVVDVHDTGGGMSAEVRERAFEPFFTTKARGAGAGLGLSICQSLVEEMGGRMELPEPARDGTTVRVVLRRAPDSHLDAGLPSRSPTPVPAPRRLEVLVVDDEEGIRRLVGSLLSHHDVSTASSGEQAIAMLDRPWDVVLCDLTMPEGTGQDVYRAIVAADPELAKRTVFMTGGAFSDEMRAFVDRTDRPVLRKPFDAHQLRRAVRRAARGR